MAASAQRPNVTVTVIGARELRRAMKAAAADMRQLTDVNRDVGSIVLARGRSTAPYRTGALQGSLRSAPTRTKARVQSRLTYAQPIHWGVPSRGIDPNPWLSNAAVNTEARWTTLYTDRINELIDEVGRQAS